MGPSAWLPRFTVAAYSLVRTTALPTAATPKTGGSSGGSARRPTREEYSTTDAGQRKAVNTAGYIMRQAKIDRGICLVLGCGHGYLARALTERSGLRIIAVDTDQQRADALRSALLDEKFYGGLITVHHVESYDKLPLPAAFANLIVAGETFDLNDPPMDAIAVVNQLRPDGGPPCRADRCPTRRSRAARSSPRGLPKRP